MTRDVSRSYLITKVLPAIVAKWPREARGETIWIQQDNARTHIEPNDEAFRLAVQQTGLDIRIFNQPPNSPDLNILDLGFFASLQSKTFLTQSKNMDDLIQNVQREFSSYDESKIRNVFLTLQGCMIEVDISFVVDISFAVDISFVVDIAGTRWARSRSFAGYILYIAA